ncbi:MAG: helicase HerA-like domain-containing protein [Polyangiaceae bacterium]
MTISPEFLEAVRTAYPRSSSATLGAPVLGGACAPEPVVTLAFGTLNRHGLVAGATGTGKTKTLQALTEKFSRAGIPVFVSDVKGDLSGLAAPGVPNEKVVARAADVGVTWAPEPCLVELLSLSGARGAHVRATVSSFGPSLLAKVLGLNATQTSVLTMVFKYADDHGLPLLDVSDLRTLLVFLGDARASDLAAYGNLSKASLGVLLREVLELDAQGGAAFFGEPEFDVDDLFYVDAAGRGLVSILSLSDVQTKPALFSTFMMWLLARLYEELPEVGDLEKPKLVFFFDEAHLLFRDASDAFVAEVERVVRLVRSKGVGIFFVTQSPKDVPSSILGQLGNRIQHALRAFTPDDERAMKAAARTFPKSPYYDVQAVLTSLGTGEALVTVLAENGAPTMPVVCRVAPPTSRMGPLTDAEFAQVLGTEQVKHYATALDRPSAREMLEARMRGNSDPAASDVPVATSSPGPVPTAPPVPASTGPGLEDILNSPLARSVATTVTRGLMGALIGKAPRRRSRRR